MYLHIKFQVSSIIIMLFRQGWGMGGGGGGGGGEGVNFTTPPHPKRTPKKETQIRIKFLNFGPLQKILHNLLVKTI